MILQGLAARVDGDRFLEWNIALFKLLDNGFEFGEGALEGQGADVLIIVLGQDLFFSLVKLRYFTRIAMTV